MRTALRILTGVLVLAAYRVTFEVLKLLANELIALCGEAIAAIFMPFLICGGLVAFGFVVTFIVHRIDRA